MNIMLLIVLWMGVLALLVWCIVAVADGVRAWQFEAVMERAEKSEARRRETNACRAEVNAALRESAAPEYSRPAALRPTVIVLVPNKSAANAQRVSLN